MNATDPVTRSEREEGAPCSSGAPGTALGPDDVRGRIDGRLLMRANDARRGDAGPWETPGVVAAVHFYATATDQEQLLDHLGEPDQVSLHPWPLVATPRLVLSREAALAAQQVMIVSHRVGPPAVVREGDPALVGPSRAALFNRMNWERLRPAATDGLVDSNASPVLLWAPAVQRPDGLRSGHIGSQADSMRAVSEDYERWATRSMNWVRRKGTQVWGWRPQQRRPDLDVRRPDVTTVYALPGALRLLQDGIIGL